MLKEMLEWRLEESGMQGEIGCPLMLQLMNEKEDKLPVLTFGTEQVCLLVFNSQVISCQVSSQCSDQRHLDCLLLDIV